MKLKFTIKKSGLIAALFLCAIFLANNASADDCPPSGVKLQVPLGTITCAPTLGDYLKLLYRFSLSIVGIIAITMIMIGGVKWITAAGNQSKVQQAKDYIFSSIVGIALLLGAFTILNLINPRLTNIGINIDTISAPKASITTQERAQADVAVRNQVGSRNYCCLYKIEGSGLFSDDYGCQLIKVSDTTDGQNLAVEQCNNLIGSTRSYGEELKPGNRCVITKSAVTRATRTNCEGQATTPPETTTEFVPSGR